MLIKMKDDQRLVVGIYQYENELIGTASRLIDAETFHEKSALGLARWHAKETGTETILPKILVIIYPNGDQFTYTSPFSWKIEKGRMVPNDDKKED